MVILYWKRDIRDAAPGTVSQPAHDVKTTVLGRYYSVLTSFQRPYNVVLTSCAGLGYSIFQYMTPSREICSLRLQLYSVRRPWIWTVFVHGYLLSRHIFLVYRLYSLIALYFPIIDIKFR